jgi:exosortase
MLSDLPIATQVAPNLESVQVHRLAVLAGLALLTLLLAAMYLPVIPDLVMDWWTDEGYSFGFLIPPLAGYIVWSRREAIRRVPARPDSRGLLLLAAGCLTYLLGAWGLEYFLSRISLVIVAAGLIWSLTGLARLKLMVFPLVVLVTMVPLPMIVYYQLTTPLQLLASSVAATIAQSLGVALYRDGNILQLATTPLGVAEACSGLHSAASLAVSALLVGYMECRLARNRVAIFLLAVPVAVGLNVLRVTGTALLAEWNPDLAMGFYHLFAGWLVFVAGFGILYLLARALNFVSGER